MYYGRVYNFEYANKFDEKKQNLDFDEDNEQLNLVGQNIFSNTFRLEL